MYHTPHAAYISEKFARATGASIGGAIGYTAGVLGAGKYIAIPITVTVLANPVTIPAGTITVCAGMGCAAFGAVFGYKHPDKVGWDVLLKWFLTL